jgi:hypothetical protein
MSPDGGNGALSEDENTADVIASLTKQVTWLTGLLLDAERKQDEAERPYQLLPVENFLTAVDPPEFIVNGLFEERSVIGLVAPPESGKSLLMLDIAVCVALGRHFHGRKVKQGLVVYLAGEGQHGLHARLQALQRYGFGKNSIPLVIAKAATSLLDPHELNRVRTAIQAACVKYNLPLVLLIIDTLARFIVPGDESKAQDMGAYLNAIDALRGDAAAVSLHHPGHGDNTRGRGSSSWKAGLDAEFSIANSNQTITVTCQKMKDGAKPAPFSFRIEPAATRMKRADGSPVQSVVLVPTDATPPPIAKGRGKHQEKTAVALKEWRRTNPEAAAISTIDLYALFKAQGIKDRRRRREVLDSFVNAKILTHSIGGYLVHGEYL